MTALKLPADHESEICVIGCCLLGGLDTALEAVEKIPAAAFMRDDCQMAWGVIEALATKGTKINEFTFRDEWVARSDTQVPTEISLAHMAVGSALNLDYFVEKIMDPYRRRKIIYAATDLLKHAEDRTRPVDQTVSEFEAELSGYDVTGATVHDGGECCKALIDDLERRFNLQGKRSGLVTGLWRLDQLTDGLQAGELTVIGARPSAGKTAIALNIVERVCLSDGHPTLIVTCEMSETALMRRLLSAWMKVPMKSIRSGTFSKEDFALFGKFNERVKESTIKVFDGVGGLDINRLSAVVRRACRKYGIKLVVIDYLQKIQASGRHEKRTYAIGEVSGVLKALAVQTGAAFLVLAQLNRESDRDKGRMPRLSDLADSSQIERDADTVALLHRDRDQDGGTKATLGIAKQRDGEIGLMELAFNGEFCRFENPKH